MKKVLLIALAALVFTSCKKDTKASEPEPTQEPTPNDCPASSCVSPATSWTKTGSGPHLIFKFKFDSTQARLNNFGIPTGVAAGNAGFSPIFNGMSAHYIEMTTGDLVQVGGGSVLYKANETSCGGAKAITFCQSVVVRQDSTFFSIPISSVAPGSYKWLRVSLAYQNYDIPYLTTSTGNVTQWGTVASFVGFNTYVNQYKIKNLTATPTASVGGPGNHKQGYWGFEYNILGVNNYMDGQSQAGATTVVNPNPQSIIPPGSCLVTGQFYSNTASSNQNLVITGNETSDIIVWVSLSTNKSFEWKDIQADGYFKPEAGEFPVDMGIRGMIPKY